MSVGPTGTAGSISGSPLAQTQGGELDRTQQGNTSQSRRTQADRRAADAAGVGQTEQDHEASDRDADGRRPWELGHQPARDDATDPDSTDTTSPGEPPSSRDATGQRGNHLDLSG